MSTSVTLDGFEEIQKTFSKLDKDFARELLKEVTQISFEKAKKQASTHNVTGEMEMKMFQRVNKKSAVIGSTAPHAIFVHFGTRPHKIFPKDKKALRWASGSRWFFSTKPINHPGYKGDPFIHNAIVDTFKDLEKIKQGIIDVY